MNNTYRPAQHAAPTWSTSVGGFAHPVPVAVPPPAYAPPQGFAGGFAAPDAMHYGHHSYPPAANRPQSDPRLSALLNIQQRLKDTTKASKRGASAVGYTAGPAVLGGGVVMGLQAAGIVAGIAGLSTGVGAAAIAGGAAVAFGVIVGFRLHARSKARSDAELKANAGWATQIRRELTDQKKALRREGRSLNDEQKRMLKVATKIDREMNSNGYLLAKSAATLGKGIGAIPLGLFQVAIRMPMLIVM